MRQRVVGTQGSVAKGTRRVKWGQRERPAPKKTKRAGRWSDNYELAVTAVRSATTASAAMKSATATVRAAYAAVEATATAATMVAATGRAGIAVRG